MTLRSKLALLPASAPALAAPELTTPSVLAWDGPILDRAARHGLVGEIVDAIEPHSEAEPTAILTQLLVAAGNAIGREPYVEIAGGRSRLNLYAAIVGPSADSRKGTSLSYVRQIMEVAVPEWSSHTASGIVSGAGMVRKLADLEDDARLLVVEEELGPVLRSGSQHSGMLREAWDGHPIEIMRSKTSLRVEEPHVSIIGHVTVEELQSTLRAVDRTNGVANRILWVATGRVRLLPDGGCLPTDVVEALGARLGTAIVRASKLGAVGMTAAASKRWQEVYTEMETQPQTEISPITNRKSAQVRRLAALYGVLDGAATVDVEHLDAALALWRYAQESAELIFGGSTGSVESRIRRALRERGRMTKTEIRDLFARKARADEIEKALDRLREAGLAVRATRSTGGRPEESWTTTEGR